MASAWPSNWSWRRLGAKGLKIPKALGLAFEAGERLPIAIYIGDPVAFWNPPTPDDERHDELSVHPGWSYYGHPVPS